MVAAVGAIVLARRRRGLDDDGIDEELRTRLRPAYTGTMAESIGVPARTPQPPPQVEVRTGEPVPQPVARVAAATSSPTRANATRGAGRWPSAGTWPSRSSSSASAPAGVLIRPNPLVILLCLELMLNAANLALVAFSRMWGGDDGQVFALIVMVVAACEVTVGLGLIVAIYRRQMAVNVDELNELRG